VIRVFVVDDQPIFCDLVELTLSNSPKFLVVGRAHSAVSLDDHIQATRPDLILMDIEMPGVNGLAATARITMQHPSIQVGVTSIQAGEEVRSLALQAGALDFIPKHQFSEARLKQALPQCPE